MNAIGLFGVLSGSAVALAFFLASFFLGIKRREDSRHVWLGLILIAIGLRIGKSVIYFLANEIAPIGLSLGFFGLACIGPFVWFLLKDTAALTFKNAWHFIIPITGAVSCFIVTPSPLETTFYQIGTAILMIYLIVSWMFAISRNQPSIWNRKVLIMATGVWVALVYQHLANSMMHYAFGAIIASVFLYWIFYQSFKSAVFSKGLSVKLPDQTLAEVREAFENQNLYRKQGITLQTFSGQLSIPPYLVTRSVKKLYDRTFPEALNYFRVEEIKQMLLDPDKEHLKIESLAYDVGFTSPSAFYAAFKKITGQTPTSYQKDAELMSA
ncbi:MAG: AraC family transcriptional regulator [Ekhidna sp.]